ncbi:MAG TPA: hypothetical protein VK181_02450 [Rhizobium sp.]|nr:hypothetical protein [Rhizobium sp.]
MSSPLNIPAMEDQVRRAALSLLPAAANATWQRQTAVAGEENLLGEVEGDGVRTDEWPVCVYLIRYKENKGRWTPAGIVPDGTQDFLMKPGPAAEPLTPQNGDLLMKDGVSYRVRSVKTQDVDDVRYWHCESDRVTG